MNRCLYLSQQRNMGQSFKSASVGCKATPLATSPPEHLPVGSCLAFFYNKFNIFDSDLNLLHVMGAFVQAGKQPTPNQCPTTPSQPNQMPPWPRPLDGWPIQPQCGMAIDQQYFRNLAWPQSWRRTLYKWHWLQRTHFFVDAKVGEKLAYE